MSVSEVQEKRTAHIVLAVTGEKTKNVSIGSLATDGSAWDAQKALNIMTALTPCLNGSFSKGRTVPTYVLEED